jgi:hypothetical protein
MATSGRRLVARQVITYECLALACIVAVIWLNEVLDLPSRLLGAEPTPVNWRESLFETVLIVGVGVVIVRVTARLFARMRHLEGILPICASCKRIRDEHGVWHAVEAYVHDRSEAEFSHGICPACAHRLYPGYESD